MGNSYSYSVFLLSVCLEAGRGDHLVKKHVEKIISKYLKDKFDIGGLIRRPYVVWQPKLKLRSGTGTPETCKTGDVVVWVKPWWDKSWCAILIECKFYKDRSYISKDTIEQLTEYKNSFTECDGYGVHERVPLLCCQNIANISIELHNALNDAKITVPTFSEDAFKTCSETLNGAEEDFLKGLYEQICRLARNL